MFRTLTIAAVATSALAAPAFAGSLEPVAVEPVVPVAPAPIVMGSDWTGGFGGLSLGYGDVDGTSYDDDGLVYGLHGGYDYDMGNFVIGAEAEYEANDFSNDLGYDIDSMTRVKLRAGYDAGPALIYATVGGVWVDANNPGDDNGWVAGVGAEYKVTDNISVGGEYLYNKVDDFGIPGEDLEVNTFNARVNYRF